MKTSWLVSRKDGGTLQIAAVGSGIWQVVEVREHGFTVLLSTACLDSARRYAGRVAK